MLAAVVSTILAVVTLSGLSEAPVSTLEGVSTGAPTKEPWKLDCDGSLQALVDAAPPGGS